MRCSTTTGISRGPTPASETSLDGYSADLMYNNASARPAAWERQCSSQHPGSRPIPPTTSPTMTGDEAEDVPPFSGRSLRLRNLIFGRIFCLRSVFSGRIMRLHDQFSGRIMRLRNLFSGRLMRLHDQFSGRIIRLFNQFSMRVLRLRNQFSGRSLRLRNQSFGRIFRLRNQFPMRMFRLRNLFSRRILCLRNLFSGLSRRLSDTDDSFYANAPAGFGTTTDLNRFLRQHGKIALHVLDVKGSQVLFWNDQDHFAFRVAFDFESSSSGGGTTLGIADLRELLHKTASRYWEEKTLLVYSPQFAPLDQIARDADEDEGGNYNRRTLDQNVRTGREAEAEEARLSVEHVLLDCFEDHASVESVHKTVFGFGRSRGRSSTSHKYLWKSASLTTFRLTRLGGRVPNTGHPVQRRRNEVSWPIRCHGGGGGGAKHGQETAESGGRGGLGLG
eukprot:g14319.t1